MHYTSDPNEYLKEQQRRMQQPLPQDRTGDFIFRLGVAILGWTFTHVRSVFLIYFAPFLLGGVAYLAGTFCVAWYDSLAPGTLSFSLSSEGHVLKAIGHWLGLTVLFLLAIAGTLGTLAAAAYGVYAANWVTRIVSAYYLVSAGRALYYWFYRVRTDHPFGTIFLICFGVCLVSEGVQILWRKFHNREE